MRKKMARSAWLRVEITFFYRQPDRNIIFGELAAVIIANMIESGHVSGSFLVVSLAFASLIALHDESPFQASTRRPAR